MTLILFTLSLIIGQAFSQAIFINNFPGYSALPSCAEVPLSVIVRDMVDGCGDDQHTTSYSCFCTASSSHYDQVISASVASSCTASPSSAASAALEVFASYCGLGSSPATIATTTSNQSSSSPTVLVSSSSSKYTLASDTSSPIPSDVSNTSEGLCTSSGLVIYAAVGLVLFVVL